MDRFEKGKFPFKTVVPISKIFDEICEHKLLSFYGDL